MKLLLFGALAQLAVVPAAEVEGLPGSVATWVLASKLGIDLVARERVVPIITRRGGRIEARWAAALAASEDAEKVAALAKSMPPAAHAVPVAESGAGAVWAPDALLRAYLDAVVCALVRGAEGAPALPKAGGKAPRASADACGARWSTTGSSCRWSTARRSSCGSCSSRPTIPACPWTPPMRGRRRGAASRSSGAPFAIRRSRCSRR